MEKMDLKPALYVVATPIGNLDDISHRATSVLRSVDLIVAEDTRHTRQLLHHLGVNRPMLSLNEQNEREMTPKLIARMGQGEVIALVSDAGTPLVSDPGYHLVAAARAAGLKVSPIPGACAAIAALSVAGLASDKFIFEGFLPAKAGPREKRLAELQDETRTLIFYEAPHRIKQSLTAMAKVFGEERYAVIARELTKLYETVHGDTLAGLLQWLDADKEQCLGEFVVLVKGVSPKPKTEVCLAVDVLLVNLVKELPVKQAAKLASQLTGLNKNELYQRCLALKDG